MQAQRSFLMQLQEMDRERRALMELGVTELSDETVTNLVRDFQVRAESLNLTAQRIEETKPA